MVRKYALMLATAAAVGGAAFTPVVASAGSLGKDIRSDIRDIHRDQVDLRRDKRELGRDVATGRYGAAQRELTDIRRDSRDLQRDYRDLGRDVSRRGY
jgi:hypothetical protein